MSIDMRKKDCDWQVLPKADGSYTHEAAQLTVLMDIRDELRTLNKAFGRYGSRNIYTILERISRNTAKPRKKKRK